MTPHRTLITATLAAAAAAAAITALPAAGHDAKPAGTLTFTTTQGKGDEVYVDAAPRGESVGDRFMVSSTLRRSGALAGRLEGDCVGLDARYEALDCGADPHPARRPSHGQGRRHVQARPRRGTDHRAVRDHRRDRRLRGRRRRHPPRPASGDRDTLTVTFSG